MQAKLLVGFDADCAIKALKIDTITNINVSMK